MYAPAGTPDPIVSKLNREITKALNDPEISKLLAGQGAEARPGPPSALTELMKTDISKWKGVADRIGYRVD
jgi:tripartite-type tricarboxylate transporter receptor subunit TctC